jgi:predicted glycoside hydrolase/deacetylase ChbG (UPF0249 family)
MTGPRYLIVNADDFGQSRGVNRGIIAARERGIVTSASLMVRWPAAAEAADHARRDPGLSVGLHLDLGEWICRDGKWTPLYEVVQQKDAAAVAGEVAGQLAAFRRLTGRDPTHIDSHQHAHMKEPVRSIVAALARTMSVPLRRLAADVHYCGGFYGQKADGSPLPEILTPDGLTAILAGLPPGTSELGCHPGELADDDLDTMYRDERAREVQTLCDPRVRACLAPLGIVLCSFADLPGRRTLRV